MVLATGLILALCTLNDLDPIIRWHFSAGGCRPCLEKQLELMETFFRPGDQITIFTLAGEKNNLADLRGELGRKFPDAAIELRAAKGFSGVGWTFEDPHAGERISFTSMKGGYNGWRARQLLKLIR